MASAPTCASADVARLIPERVGNTGGDFTATTTPTLTQVNALIAGIVQEVQAVVGPLVDDSLAAFATLTVATGTAAQVELAFTDQEARDTTSKYEWLQQQYRGSPPANDPTKIGGRLGMLADAEAKIAAGGQPGISDPAAPWATLPDTSQFGFPQTTWQESY